jgi:hypothetical protein
MLLFPIDKTKVKSFMDSLDIQLERKLKTKTEQYHFDFQNEEPFITDKTAVSFSEDNGTTQLERYRSYSTISTDANNTFISPSNNKVIEKDGTF